MELSPICKKEYPGAAGTVSQRVPGSGAYAPLPLLRPAKKGASGDFGAAHRWCLCRADDRHLCPRLCPAQLLCRGAGLPLYGTWLPALPALQQRYPNRQVVLEVEPPDHTAPNARRGNGGWISMPKTAFSPATCRYGCAAWHWMCSRPAGRHWILPPIKGFIARSLAVWRPFLCKSANKTPPSQILLVF